MDASPPIQYATTSDGTKIAFYALGKGPPILLLRPHPSSHLSLEWQAPAFRDSYLRLARDVTLVRLDFRGAGLSDRQIDGLTMESVLADISSVVERLALERVGILASGGFAGICALVYAASFPERVSRVVCVDISDGESDLNKAVADLRMVSPSVHSRVRASVMAGSLGPEDIAALTLIYKEATGTEGHKAFVELTRKTEIRSILPRVEAPVLFMHTEGNEIYPLSLAQDLVAALARAALHFRPRASASFTLTGEHELQVALAFLLNHDAEVGRTANPAEIGRPLSRGLPDGLSQREAEVLSLIVLGRTNHEIAKDLTISSSTVSHHLTNIFRKTNSANRTEAAGYAHRHGLV